MTKTELTKELLNLYRSKSYKLALVAKQGDECGILRAKTELHYLVNSVVPTLLGYSKAYREFKQQALEILESQRETKGELRVNFVI